MRPVASQRTCPCRATPRHAPSTAGVVRGKGSTPVARIVLINACTRSQTARVTATAAKNTFGLTPSQYKYLPSRQEESTNRWVQYKALFVFVLYKYKYCLAQCAPTLHCPKGSAAPPSARGFMPGWMWAAFGDEIGMRVNT